MGLHTSCEIKHPSYWCKTFGQEFQRADKSFYRTFPVTCQWDKTWSTSTIAHTCQCESNYQQRFISQDIFLSSGSKCVTPLLPPTRHNLVPVWDKNNPPGRLDIRVVPSDQCYLRAWLHVNIQMFCRRSAQPTDIRLQSGHLQSDLPPRKSVLYPYLADLCCKYYTSLQKCIF